MDGEDALKKEEERLMRAISRQGSVRTGAIKAAPKVAPKPVETPKVTPPASNRNSVSFSRSASRLSTTLSAEEQHKLEQELQEQERKREEERKTLERLDSAHFNKKQHSKDWFDIEFKDEDVDDTPAASNSNSNLSVKSVLSVPQSEPVANTPVAIHTSTPKTTVTTSAAPTTSTVNTNTKVTNTAVPATSTAHTTSTHSTVNHTASSTTNTNSSSHARVTSTGTTTPSAPKTTATPSAPVQQGWVSDMDQLINSLATLGTGVTPRHKSPQEIALDTATTTLRSLKWNFAAPLPEPRHAELGVWIKSLGADLRQLRGILESSPPLHSSFPYVTCAGVTQSLATAVLDSLALVSAAADRKDISTALLALVDHTLDWFEAMGRDSSDATALRDSTGEALTALVRQVTAVIKRQTELSTAPPSGTVPAPTPSRQAVVSIVEECARHAELISETLKSPPYNLELFRQQLHQLVAAVKKIDPYLAREGDRETVVQSTKHVLEMAIELQGAPDQSPLPVLTAISELLRALTAALRSQ